MASNAWLPIAPLNGATYQLAKPTVTKLFCSLLEARLANVVLTYIKNNPGQRLYQIDKGTLKSHHNWGTKYIVERLESEGRLFVKRLHHGKAVYEDGRKVWPTYYHVG